MADTNGTDNGVADIDDDVDDGGVDRGKRRSGVTYPYYSLEDALSFAKSVRDRGGNEVREDDLLEALKLSRSTKSWIYKLSSAREFGLLQRRGRKSEARVVVTELAKKLLLPGDEAETQAATLNAFLSPQLYQKLYERYAGAAVPPTDRLANVLQREHDLLETVATPAAQAFIDSAKFAGLVSQSGHIATKQSIPAVAQGSGTSIAEQKPEPQLPTQMSPPPAAHQQPPAGFSSYGFQLRKDLRVDLMLPTDLTTKDVKRLHRWLETLPIDDSNDSGNPS